MAIGYLCRWRLIEECVVRRIDLARRQLADRVGDCDVCAAARGLLGGGDLQDTVDVDFENNLKDSITGLHGRDGCESELSEGCVVLAVYTLALEDRELHGLLVVCHGGEGPVHRVSDCVRDQRCQGKTLAAGLHTSS